MKGGANRTKRHKNIPKILADNRMIGEIYGGLRIYQRKSGVIREQGSWHRGRWKDRGEGRDVQRDKQHLFPNETERVATLPYLDQRHGAHQCPEEELLKFCRFFFFFAPA